MSLQQRRPVATAAASTTPSSSTTNRRIRVGGGGASRRKKRVACSPFAVFVAFTVIFWLVTSVYYLRTHLLTNHNDSNNNNHKIIDRNKINSYRDRLRLFSKQTTTTAAADSSMRVNGETAHTEEQQPPLSRNKRGAVPKETETIDMRDMSATLAFEDVDGGAWKQGWNVQPVVVDGEDNPLYIYVLPHSHCDPGWIKTFDEYFRSQTKGILSTVVEALAKDKRRRFVWAEISYFEWWWRDQTTETQQLTRRLLRDGQLEFVTGGWVQPDEANTQLYAMEVQLQEGHDWIAQTFGPEYIPRYGWSIDPFGYSPTMAYLLQKYKFRGMLIQRVHYAVKKELALHQQLEFMWRQVWDEEGKHDIFTHLMPFYSYDVPHTCGPDPAVCCQFDFARGALGRYGQCPWRTNPQPITQENVAERAMLLLDQYKKKANLYRSNTVLAPLGDDFRYRDAREAENQYQNYQAIFDYLNENVPGVHAQFGTLSDYFDRVIGSFEVPVLKGAFFTYSDREQDYWSGYFTSRVFDKALDRKLERVLYAAESLGATKTELQGPRRALSLFQHHDGVTGTAKNHVVQDYAKRIHQAIHTVQDWIQSKLALQQDELMTGGGGDDETGACWQSDAPRGLSQNLCSETKQAFVYNPLDTVQYCRGEPVPSKTVQKTNYPCDVVPKGNEWDGKFKFDSYGMMMEPVREQWKVWRVRKGGAYLFFPGSLLNYNLQQVQKVDDGWLVTSEHWKRTVIPHKFSDEFGNSAIVLDFIYETNLQTSNEEWLVRLNSRVQNNGVFHTDLNGFNFDTHHYRKDMPIQSQVFPMPTLASIEDHHTRLTVLSEHAQGTASLEEGSIDVWLDRRLSQDDARGLGQGVMDNVPTRTRLRVVMETDGFTTEGEFQPTPLCQRMWDELNHPLEAFGYLEYDKNPQKAKEQQGQYEILGMTGVKNSEGGTKENNDPKTNDGGDQKHVTLDVGRGRALLQPFNRGGNLVPDPPNAEELKPDKDQKERQQEQEDWRTELDGWDPIVPLVYMVYKRVDYLKESIESLRRSDFDAKRVPIVISIDGHVPEMMEYVKTLEPEFKVTTLIHPYSCHDHPDTFPGNDESLNDNFGGDSYGNKRSAWATCCKHHFTWMFQTVFTTESLRPYDAFLFTEEDYVVAPNFYETVARGLKIIHDDTTRPDRDGYFGIALDPTDGNTRGVPIVSSKKRGDGFNVKAFVSGPMVLQRNIHEQFLQHGRAFCTFDDYNWDWSLVHLQSHYWLPAFVLLPTSPQVKHIGVEGGMHNMNDVKRKRMEATVLSSSFHARHVNALSGAPHRKPKKGFGGWAHPADHAHCLRVLGIPTENDEGKVAGGDQ